MKGNTLLTTSDVALHYGVTTREVLYATRKGLLDDAAQKIGWSWIYAKERLPAKWPVRTKRRRKEA